LALTFGIFGIDKAYQKDSCYICIYQYINETQVSLIQGTVVKGVGNLVLALMMTLFVSVSIYSVVFSLRRLNRPGVSKDLRMLFIKKHVIYVTVFTLIWVI
jgi:hypothetical protein